MRAIIILGLAWSIAICATPSLADRYVTGTQISTQRGGLANPSFAPDAGNHARFIHASAMRDARSF